jgi:signal transduction histidine kinase
MRIAPTRRSLGRLATLTALAVASLAPVASAAAADQKRVLVLYSTRRDTQIAITCDRELPGLLEQGLGTKPDFYSEYIDSARFPEEQYTTAFRHYLNLKYATSRFDLVIAMAGFATQFVAAHRNDLFRDTPVVYFTNDRTAGRPRNSTAVLISQDYRPTLRLALALQPDTTQVFVVVGNSQDDKSMEAGARAQFESFAPGLAFTYLSNLTTEALERRVAALPEHSIIYYLLFYQDADGANVNPLEYLDRLSPIANRPMYSWVDSTMSRGIVGGGLVSLESEVDAVATLAVRVLNGERADDIPESAPDLHIDQVDWRQLQRWHISEARVPPGTQILFRQPGVWDRYKAYILGAAALLLAQTALIAGLIAQSARRRDAEEQARRSESELRSSYGRIRDLGHRLITAQEAERGRIARELHDDIIQQVALLGINLELITGKGYDPTMDAEHLGREALTRVRRIAASVRALSHRLHPAKLRLTGLVSSLAGLQNELSRPGFTVTFSHENVPLALPDELTLCLYRIVQEALQNAAKHSGARQASIHLSGSSEGLALTIADNGKGFDVDAAWGRGLGLISMVERLEPFKGSLKVRSKPGAGTRLDVKVPRSALLTAESVAV